jgi:hypothetical protein
MRLELGWRTGDPATTKEKNDRGPVCSRRNWLVDIEPKWCVADNFVSFGVRTLHFRRILALRTCRRKGQEAYAHIKRQASQSHARSIREPKPGASFSLKLCDRAPPIYIARVQSLSAPVRLGVAALALLALWSGCATRPAPVAPPAPYVRVTEVNSNRVELQVAVRKFQPPYHKGPSVWLVGVSHVGDADYYRAVQRELDACTLVLYEGIRGPADPERQPLARADAKAASPLQDTLAASLGLEFQLSAIDYTGSNFVNSDLSVAELQELMAQQAARMGTNDFTGGQSLQSLLDLMQGNSFMSSVLQVVFKIMGSSPKLQGLGRLALLELIDTIQGDPEKLAQSVPELHQLLQVLVQERDKRVVDDLRELRHDVPRAGSLAVFYGLAHMTDLEQRLRNLGYRPVGDRWLTAFAVDLKRCGISNAERQFLSRLINSQFKTPATR